MIYPTIYLNDNYSQILLVDNEIEADFIPFVLPPTTDTLAFWYDLLWDFIDQYQEGYINGYTDGVEALGEED